MLFSELIERHKHDHTTAALPADIVAALETQFSDNVLEAAQERLKTARAKLDEHRPKAAKAKLDAQNALTFPEKFAKLNMEALRLQYIEVGLGDAVAQAASDVEKLEAETVQRRFPWLRQRSEKLNAIADKLEKETRAEFEKAMHDLCERCEVVDSLRGQIFSKFGAEIQRDGGRFKAPPAPPELQEARQALAKLLARQQVAEDRCTSAGAFAKDDERRKAANAELSELEPEIFLAREAVAKLESEFSNVHGVACGA